MAPNGPGPRPCSSTTLSPDSGAVTGRSFDRDGALGAVRSRLGHLRLQVAVDLGAGDHRVALVIELEHLGAHVPAAGVTLADVPVDGDLHHVKTRRSSPDRRGWKWTPPKRFP